MLDIDGADGGGQMLRSALSLAALTDTPVRIENVRGDRPTPGLRPQHLAAVEVLAELCDATVEGAALESTSLTFKPGEDRQTAVETDIATAGSVTLLFDTVLPLCLRWPEQIRVRATGGTDVKWAPTVAYYRRVKLPLLARFGLDAAVALETTGFYPAGGGEATLRANPSTVSPIQIDARGSLDTVGVYSKAATALEDQEVADRQADHASERLGDAGYDVQVQQASYVDTACPGSSLLLRGTYAHSLAGFDALGERGLPSEEVADGAVEAFLAFDETAAALDPHMADQLLVFLALAGGRVRIPRVTDHVETNLDVLAAFGADVSLRRPPGELPVVDATAHPDLA